MNLNKMKCYEIWRKKENICWPLIWRKGSLHLYHCYVVSMHCGHWSTGNTSSLDECSRKGVWGKCLGLFFTCLLFFFFCLLVLTQHFPFHFFSKLFLKDKNILFPIAYNYNIDFIDLWTIRGWNIIISLLINSNNVITYVDKIE